VADTQQIDPEYQVVVYWGDLTLWQAAKYVADKEAYWLETELPVRDRFKMSSDDYWSMTVADHARMVEYLGG